MVFIEYKIMVVFIFPLYAVCQPPPFCQPHNIQAYSPYFIFTEFYLCRTFHPPHSFLK